MEVCFVHYPVDKYPSCHSSTICQMPNGDILASWFAGLVESSDDTVLLGSRLKKGEKIWRDPFVIVNVAGHASGNPRLFIGPDKAVWLLSPINYGHWCQNGTILFLKRSYDNGRTWTDLELFCKERGLLGKNKPLQLKADPDIWIIPVEYEKKWIAAFIRSDNGGQDWNVVGDIGRRENVRLHQPTIVELSDGGLLVYMRSWEGYIYQSRSLDKGKTWSVSEPTVILNNNSGIDMVSLESGNLLLVCNPVGLGKNGNIVVDQKLKTNKAEQYTIENLCIADDRNSSNIFGQEKITEDVISDLYPCWGPRTPLSLILSMDEGKTWKIKKDLENGEGEYSYPAVIQDKEGIIHVIYTFKRTHIKHVSLTEDELIR